MKKIFDVIFRPFRWMVHRIKHKMHHFSIDALKKMLRQHGLALVVIFLVWELLEDVLFPLLFIWMGNEVSPWFLGLAPVSWLLCLHPIAVPILWGVWIKISKKEESEVDSQ